MLNRIKIYIRPFTNFFKNVWLYRNFLIHRYSWDSYSTLEAMLVNLKDIQKNDDSSSLQECIDNIETYYHGKLVNAVREKYENLYGATQLEFIKLDTGENRLEFSFRNLSVEESEYHFEQQSKECDIARNKEEELLMKAFEIYTKQHLTWGD